MVPRLAVIRDGLRFIESNAVPDDAAIRLRSVTDTCAPLGFKPCLWSTVAAIGPVEAYSTTMIDSAGTMYAVAAWVRVATCKPPGEELNFAAVSRLAESRLVMTTNAKKRLNPPRGFQILHLPTRDVRGVLNRHQERLSVIPRESIVRLDEVLVRETVQDASRRIQNFQIERGVWVPLSENQVAAIINRREQSNTA
jgi:hypothetical protein